MTLGGIDSGPDGRHAPMPDQGVPQPQKEGHVEGSLHIVYYTLILFFNTCLIMGLIVPSTLTPLHSLLICVMCSSITYLLVIS